MIIACAQTDSCIGPANKHVWHPARRSSSNRQTLYFQELLSKLLAHVNGLNLRAASDNSEHVLHAGYHEFCDMFTFTIRMHMWPHVFCFPRLVLKA